MKLPIATDRAEEIQELFDAVVELPPSERRAILVPACATRPDLRVEVEDLLRAFDQHAADVRRMLEQLTAAAQEPEAEEIDEPAEASDYWAGKSISHFQVLERVRSGGMGVVYKALDTRLERVVALKFLRPELTSDREARLRLMREARAASALDHPNICTIHEVDETEEGQVFITIAYYEGDTIRDKLAHGPLPVEEALDYAVQIGQGLERAHAEGIVHRDIKPANVVIASGGRAKILDFGLATGAGDVDPTQRGMVRGTVSFMSPEQVRGEPVDHRTDIWALGVVLYEMLSGRRPFEGLHVPAMVDAIVHRAPLPLSSLRDGLPPALEEIVSKALSKQADARYPEVGEMLSDLRLVQRAMARERDPEARSAQRRTRKRRTLWLAAMVVVAGVSGAIGRWLLSDSGPVIDSIAVRPLENLTGNRDLDYYSNGITDGLISSLGQLRSLRKVVSLGPPGQEEWASKPLVQWGRELGVAAVVEGTLSTSGEEVELRMKLIEVATGYSLWERNFRRHKHDVLTLEREVARAIADRLRIDVAPGERKRLENAPPIDTLAYNLYLQGRHRLYERNVEDHRRAMRYFKASLARDSSFALAYTGLATSYLFQFYWGGLTQEEAIPIAREANNRALSLDPELSEAHVVRGLLHYGMTGRKDMRAAEEALRYAIRLSPGSANAHRELGVLLLRMNRVDEALVEARRATDLDPLFPEGLMDVAVALYHGGRYEEAHEQFQLLRDLFPEYLGGGDYLYSVILAIHIMRGEIEQILEIVDGPEAAYLMPSYRAYACAVLGRTAEALRVRDEMAADYFRGNQHVTGFLGILSVGLGDYDGALLWLERWAESPTFLILFRTEPLLNPIRSDPRFQALMEKVDRIEGLL